MDHAMDCNQIDLRGALKEERHMCSRLCVFTNLCGNLWQCENSGQVHVCDQTCSQRIWYDNHNSICRLSKRLFPHTQENQADRKRNLAEESGNANNSPSMASKRSCSGEPLQPMAAF